MADFDRAETLVQEWMSPVVITVNQNDTVRDALNKLGEHRISALPVVDSDKRFVGIVTIADFLRSVISTDQALDSNYPHYDDCLWAVDLIQRKLGTDKVGSVMTEVVATVKPGDSMCDAARNMFGLGLHHLPVVGSNGQLAGILSSTDFVRLVGDKKFPF
jgi:CBS domain-containing membrane protein